MSNQLSEQELEQRRQAALKHGGESALTRMNNDEPFTGLAADVEHEVREELKAEGRAEIVTRAAIRLETVARLFYNAVQDAAEKNDLKRLDTYVKRFGWLQSSALRAWAQVKQEEKDAANTLDYEHILASDDNNSQ